MPSRPQPPGTVWRLSPSDDAVTASPPFPPLASEPRSGPSAASDSPAAEASAASAAGSWFCLHRSSGLTGAPLPL